MRKISLPENVELIINRLNAHGYRADVVGGAIRDLYIGRPAGDYDITTAAPPEKIKEIFSDLRTIDTGIKHGTVTVHIDGENYEVTTYRRDGEYKDARHPESVEFTTRLEDDLSRRDFTINAICYNHNDGVTDIFGGCADIDARIVRTVGVAEARFSEDALRILRALRFASVLDFTIDKETSAAVHKLRALLTLVSRERIYTEWYKLCSGCGAYRIIEEYKDVIAVFIPSLEGVCMPPEEPFLGADTQTRMLSLFANLGSSEFDCAMHELKTDNKTREYGRAVLELYADFSPKNVYDALLALSRYGEEAVGGTIALGRVMGKYGDKERELIASALASGVPYKLSSLAISGRDLLALGYRGERVGETLNRLLDLVMRGSCKNDREELLCAVSDLDNNT